MTRIQLRLECIMLAMRSCEISKTDIIPENVVPIAMGYETYVSNGIDIPDNDEYYDDDDDDEGDNDDDPDFPGDPVGIWISKFNKN